MAAACARWLFRTAPSQYTQISPHSAAQTARADSDIPLGDYNELKRAILQFAEDGVTWRHPYHVPGDAGGRRRVRPIPWPVKILVGAYTIDFLTHDCSLIVSYYEITIDITFREMSETRKRLEYVTNQKEVEIAAARGDGRIPRSRHMVRSQQPVYPYESLIRQICEAEPLHYMAVPELHAANYPEEGRSRIVELTLTWPADAASLQKMERPWRRPAGRVGLRPLPRHRVGKGRAAATRILMERFTYTEQQTATPLYSRSVRA